jgi:hypothetical protein
VADYFRREEMSGGWRLGRFAPEDLPLQKGPAAVYFAASDPCRGAGSFPDRGLPNVSTAAGRVR